MLIGFTGFLYWGFRGIHRVEAPKGKSPKTLATPLELSRLGALELKLQFISNQGDELRIGGLSLGVGHCVAEEALQGVQIASVPGDFDGVPDGPLHPAGGGAEGLGYLRVEDLGDGVGVLSARLGSLLDGGCETSLNNRFCGCIYCFISCPYHCWFVGLIPMIAKSNF